MQNDLAKAFVTVVDIAGLISGAHKGTAVKSLIKVQHVIHAILLKVKVWAMHSSLIFSPWSLYCTRQPFCSRDLPTGNGCAVVPWMPCRRKDGIVHVMRAFEDDDVIHAEDTVDPVWLSGVEGKWKWL